MQPVRLRTPYGRWVQPAVNSLTITGFDFLPVNLSGTNFTGLKINGFVWGGVNTGTVNATTPAFSNLLGTFSFTVSGAFNNGFLFPLESATPGVVPFATLGTPLVLSSGTQVGITLNYQGTTDGTTYNNVNNLSPIIAAGAPPVVGSDVFNGYYRNAASETNGNFVSTLRSLGLTNQTTAVRVYGDVTPVPEPSSMALCGFAAAGFAGYWRGVAARAEPRPT